MSAAESLRRGREAFERGAWKDAYSELSAANSGLELSSDEVLMMGEAAHLTGFDGERDILYARAHQMFLEQGRIPKAVKCAFRLVMTLSERHDYAQAGGWLGRARRLLEESGEECVEQGYILIPAAIQSLEAGDAAGGLATFGQVAKIADQFDDKDLQTLSRLGRGRALVNLGEVAEGIGLIDEAMVAVTANEVSPIVAGVIYCSVIELCQDLFDVRRAQEWTSALSHWCSTQEGLVPFKGQCLIHRVTIMRLKGAWGDAMDEAQRACELYSEFPEQPAAPAAYYEAANLYRLRGDYSKADENYRLVARMGLSPQPGSALLRLAQGQAAAAEASLRLELDEARILPSRAKLLGPYVEISIASRQVESARRAADELVSIAARLGAPLLEAVAATADGSVLLAEGDTKGALGRLKEGWRLWKELDAPYDGARTRVLIGVASRELGDEDTAQMELDAARWVFTELGATPDVVQVEGLLKKDLHKVAGGLTAREVEVLRLIAAGKTNKTIASDLFLSEKTVARHVSNIFTKLSVNSRSAATAFAFQNQLAST